MSYTDKAYDELSQYRPPLTKREDFDMFWVETLEASGKVLLNPSVTPYNYPGLWAQVYDIEYDGFDGTRIHGWFIVPAFPEKIQYPCLIHYHGFAGNRGIPSDYMHWVSLGMTVLAVDVRGQCGNTGNRAVYSSGSMQGVVCNGILDRYEYYFRAVYMDSVRALDFACQQPQVEDTRIVIEGGSQGGALAMAVCSLDHRPWLALADVPSNSDLERRVEGSHGSFSVVTDYLKVFPQHTEKTLETLSYFDTMNMADKIKCGVLASVGLKDAVCPAKMYFATYNRITSPKEIRVYPFNGHEGGGAVHTDLKLRYLWEKIKELNVCT